MGGGEKADMAEGVPVPLGGGDLVAKRLLKSAFCVPSCGEGWANCMLEVGMAVETGDVMEL